MASILRAYLIHLPAAVLFTCVGFATWLWGQGSRGALTGAVKDTSGAVIPGVTVEVTDENTGVSTVVATQVTGTYYAPQLVPGYYRLTFSVQGFKKLTISNIKVDVGSTVTQDAVLEVGAVTESVEVTGQTSLVETTTSSVGTTVQISHVLEMPLADRNVFRLVDLVPGAFTVGGQMSVGGGRTRNALAMLDGVLNTRGGLAEQNIEMSPPVDTMQEFKVEVNNYGAEWGRSAGGLVNAVTKQGTNSFHGSFYEFLRNDKLDARGWSADVKPPLRRNNFGATVGGPIVRNRTFFFYSFDGWRQRSGVVETRSVGLPEWRTGDFSTATRDDQGRAVRVPIYDPETGTGTFERPRTTQPFPGNVIPPSRIDPVAAKAATFLPQPNRLPDNPFNHSGNWQENRIDLDTHDYHTARVDHDLTDRTRFFVRYIRTQPERSRDGYTRGYGVADPVGLSIDNRRQNLALNATHLFSPTFFLNFTAGVNRVFIHRKSGDCCETNYGKLLGIPNVPGEVFPRFNFGGGLAPVTEIGATGNANRIAAITNSETAGRFSRVSGNHTLKFGGAYARFNANDNSRQQPSGVWGFNGRFTQGYDGAGRSIPNTGLPFADFLLGRLNSVDARISAGIGKRIQYYAGYFQDDWRVMPNLTLNLGIRYEVETPAHEVAGRMNNFDPYTPNPLAGTADIPAAAVGVVTFPNRHGKGKYLWRWDKNNFGPRFGFAWRPFGTNDTAVRGGYGIFFGTPYDRELIQQARLGFEGIYRARHPVPFRLRDGLPPGALDFPPESELLPTFGNRGTRFETSTVQFVDPARVFPYTQNFNLTIQHQWKGVLFEVAYLGNLGRHVSFPNINLNHIPPELLPRTDIPERLRRPWTIFTSDQPQIQILAPNWGISNYHAFTFKSERRFRSGAGWVVAYTLSKWIDNVVFSSDDHTVGDNDQIQNIYNLRAEKSLSTNHTPHRLVLAPIVELPFGEGRRWLNRKGIVDALFGGWQIATIASFVSGAPFGVTVLNGPRDILGDNSDGKTLRPDLVAGQKLVHPQRGKPDPARRGLLWLNPDAFAVPALYTHGNASRTLPGILGPGEVVFDSMLAKNFRFAEHWRAQFRWELFNTFNTPQFNLPNNSFGGGGFGSVTGASGRRIMQLGLKLYW